MLCPPSSCHGQGDDLGCSQRNTDPRVHHDAASGCAPDGWMPARLHCHILWQGNAFPFSVSILLLPVSPATLRQCSAHYSAVDRLELESTIRIRARDGNVNRAGGQVRSGPVGVCNHSWPAPINCHSRIRVHRCNFHPGQLSVHSHCYLGHCASLSTHWMQGSQRTPSPPLTVCPDGTVRIGHRWTVEQWRMD